MITQKILKHYLLYDCCTGFFTWLKPCGGGMRKGSQAGSVNSSGYSQIQIEGKRYVSHKLAWLYVTGEYPECEIDHVDGNKLNNVFTNLRKCSRSENLLNTKIMKTNKTGVKGVCLNKNSGRWHAYAKNKGVQVNLGTFENFEDAVAARSAYVKTHYSEHFYREV